MGLEIEVCEVMDRLRLCKLLCEYSEHMVYLKKVIISCLAFIWIITEEKSGCSI